MNEDDNIEQLVNELAEYTGNDPEDADIEYDTGPADIAITISFGREEYECYASDDDAVEAAKQDFKNIVDELGGVMNCGLNWDNIGGMDNFVDQDDARSIVEEFLYSSLEDYDDGELEDEYGTSNSDQIVEDKLSKIDDYVEYIINNFGNEELNFFIENGSIKVDIDKIAETCVNYDGIPHFLARYDGNEIVLDCGWYCYRTN